MSVCVLYIHDTYIGRTYPGDKFCDINKSHKFGFPPVTTGPIVEGTILLMTVCATNFRCTYKFPYPSDACPDDSPSMPSMYVCVRVQCNIFSFSSEVFFFFFFIVDIVDERAKKHNSK